AACFRHLQSDRRQLDDVSLPQYGYTDEFEQGTCEPGSHKLKRKGDLVQYDCGEWDGKEKQRPRKQQGPKEPPAAKLHCHPGQEEKERNSGKMNLGTQHAKQKDHDGAEDNRQAPPAWSEQRALDAISLSPNDPGAE